MNAAATPLPGEPIILRASLAAAIADFIQKDEAMAVGKNAEGYVPLPLVAARYAAFNTLKTTFEEDFPHV